MDARGADCYYEAQDNIRVGPGDKGTLAIWHWPFAEYKAPDGFWQVEINASNYVREFRGRTLQVCSEGNLQQVEVNRYTGQLDWDLMVYTWDFTEPTAGKLRVYWNGVSAGTPLDTAVAPVGVPTRLRLGPAPGEISQGPHQVYSMAVWDDVMLEAQAAALYAETYRRPIRATDGTGAVLLSASFNGRYDADFAAGNGTFKVNGAADSYCLVHDGSRKQGRRTFLIGQPRHDFSEDDRVPLSVPCPVTTEYWRYDHVEDTNYENHAELKVLPGYYADRPVGAALGRRPVFDSVGVLEPATLRQSVHVPNDATEPGRIIRLGPVDYVHYPTGANDVYDQWGSGRRFAVVSDAGNSASQVMTDLDERYEDGYWAGAELTMLNGPAAGCRLKVSGYDATTKTLAIEGALPGTPEPGNLGVVDHRARLHGCRSWGSGSHGQRVPEMNMDAWLWEFHGDDKVFTDLEWQFAAPNSADLMAPNFLRYGRGRTVLMDGAGHSAYNGSAIFGKPGTWEDNTLECRLLLQSIEVGGPGTYQLLKREADGSGPDYADNFMLRDSRGESTKTWRRRGVHRQVSRPTKCLSPQLVRPDLTRPGTWRQDVSGVPLPVVEDPDAGTVVALVVGVGADAVSRLGYLVGRWDDETGRIAWEDETPPEGRQNPFMEFSDLRPGPAGDCDVRYSLPSAVVQGEDGKWSLIYGSQPAHPDHFMAYMLTGADDRWSFSRDEHWWENNPLSPIVGGPDRLAPELNGYGAWANRDAEWRVVHNPFTRDKSRRYCAYARGKSVNHRSAQYQGDLRPVIGLRGSDVRSMTPLPHGNCVSPLVGPLVHITECGVLGQGDCIGLYTDTALGFTSGIYSFVSEDGVHFQLFAADSEWIPRGELPGEPSRLYPGRPFRLGDRRVYYYYGGSFLNYAWTRVDGEASYCLNEGATSGLIDTSMIQRPPEGWGTLTLNANPGEGTVSVAVIDAATEEPVSGFGHGEFAGHEDGVGREALWDGQTLGNVGAETIRLEFRLNRTAAQDASPVVYAWAIGEPVAVAPPQATGLRVQGLPNPVDVVDPTPEFSWDFEDDGGLAQSAYQIIVASTKEALDDGNGDMWDTGVVQTAATAATYAGASLKGRTVYHWRVRVCDARGVWSEEW